MPAIRRFLLRILALFRTDQAEADLAREIDAHLALLEDRFARDGMTPSDARAAARRAFGGVDQAKERQRDARAFRWIDDARRDVGYAVRSLARSPAFTIAAVLTLSVGIGATTAIYSIVDTILLQPLPFPDADRLVRIREPERPRTMQSTTYQEYLEWRSRSTTMSGLAAAALDPQVLLQTREGAIRVSGGLISTNYFEVLRAKAMLGRTVVSSDDRNPDVVALSFDTWQRYFGADPGAVGSVIEFRSGGQPGRLMTVVGVMPEGMEQLGSALDVYCPIVAPPRSALGLGTLVGRLRDGVSLTVASSEANAIGEAVRPARPASAPPLTGPRFRAEYLKDGVVAPLGPALRVFLAAVAVVLMIVCANVANLLLARGSSRQREVAVRLAIGASRGRIVRQILTECLVLAAVGGVLGAALGAAGVALVKHLSTVEAEGIFRLVFGAAILPRLNEVGVDLRMFATALGLAALTGAIFGILPALHLSRTSHLQAMGARGSSTGVKEHRIRALLVTGQLAMATLLLVGAGLLANSFVNLSMVEKGYDPVHALAFQLVLPAEYSTTRKAETIDALLARLRAMPDVEAAGFAYAGILLGIEDMAGTFVPPGRTLEETQAEEGRPPRLKSMSRGYPTAMGVRLLDGRQLDQRDSATAASAVVVNRLLARRYFGNTSPVGESMAWHSGTGPAVQVEIVGVVEDVRQGAVEREPYPEIFMDYRQVLAHQQKRGAPTSMQERLAFGFLSFGIRTAGDPAAAIPSVRRAVNGVDRNAGIDAIVPMERLVANSVARQRFYAVMLGVFAGVAGLLAAIGIYGMLAYAVVQRTQEIGIRMALGAARGQVLGLVLRKGLMLTAIGIAFGLIGAAAGARYLQGMLFGLEPLDPSTFAAVGAAFACVAAVASYLPARRATAVDPVVALRTD